MKLQEITDVDLDFKSYIAVARGSLWQRDIKNAWAFPDEAAARVAAQTEYARMQTLDGSYLPIYVTANGVTVMLNLVSRVFKTLPKGFTIYGYGITQKSALAAAAKFQENLPNVEKHGVWAYQTWNGDISKFVGEYDL